MPHAHGAAAALYGSPSMALLVNTGGRRLASLKKVSGQRSGSSSGCWWEERSGLTCCRTRFTPAERPPRCLEAATGPPSETAATLLSGD